MKKEVYATNADYIEAKMKQFKLVDMREQYLDLISLAERYKLSYEDFLLSLLKAEENGKKKRHMERLLDEAHFDSAKCLKDIDYSFNPSLDAGKINYLGELDFMEARENIIIIGPPGVGKSMIATGIGRNACEAGYKVLFVNAKELAALRIYQRDFEIQISPVHLVRGKILSGAVKEFYHDPNRKKNSGKTAKKNTSLMR